MPSTQQRAHRKYIDLLRQHICEDDNIRFTMAQRVLDEPTMQILAARFAQESATDEKAAESLEKHKQFADALQRS